MKVVSVFGGPRKRGNTATVLTWVEEELRRGGHDVERVDLVDLSIAGCTGCWACASVVDAPACVIDDDAQPVFEKMMAADCVLFASPLYTWGFASQIKPFLDRLVCLVTDPGGPNYKSLIGGKKSGLIVTCGGSIANNADLIQGVYKHIVSYYSLTSPAGNLMVPNCTEPDALSEDANGQAKAYAQKLLAH